MCRLQQVTAREIGNGKESKKRAEVSAENKTGKAIVAKERGKMDRQAGQGS